MTAPGVGEQVPPLRSLTGSPALAGPVPLVCLPAAGGGSRAFDDWAPLLPGRLQPLTVRLPGRESRLAEPLPGSLQELAADLAAELGPRLPRRYAVLGHSMGALLAFELVRELRRRGCPEPGCLVVSGIRAPDRLAGVRRYTHLTDAALQRVIENMGGTDPRVLADPDLRELMLPILRGDLELCDRYGFRPEPPLGCPMVAYGGHGDDELDQALLETWRPHTTGPLETRMFPGDHFFFQEVPVPFATDLAGRLRRHVLDRAPDS